jgi:hypothetical protein
MPRKINKRKKRQAEGLAAESKAAPRRQGLRKPVPGREAQMALIAGALSRVLQEKKS